MGALQGYPTSVAEDEALLRSGGLSPRLELAVRARLSEKRALAATLDFYETRRAMLPGLEYYQERRLKSLNLLDEEGKTTYNPFDETMF